MKIYGLCLVKNEADIIEYTLLRAAKWCDKIYVLDNGSTDDTWPRVNRLSAEFPNLIPHARMDVRFQDTLRELLMGAYSKIATEDDWWCILDGDEFYVDSPRFFLENTPGKYKTVWKQDIKYFFTDDDLNLYVKDPMGFSTFNQVENKLKHYISNYSEMRFFRHSQKLMGKIPWAGYLANPKRIRVKHYPHRSPSQIQLRLDTRKAAIAASDISVFPHETMAVWKAGQSGVDPSSIGDWRDKVVPAASQFLSYDNDDGNYVWSGGSWIPPKEPSLVRLRRILRPVRAILTSISQPN